MNSTQEQVLELLGKGVAPAIVATTLGITPGYISQCTADPEFAVELQSMLLTSQLAASQRDESLDELEDLLIDKVRSTAAYIVKPMEAIKALQMINSMKRRGLGDTNANAATHNTTVVLNLPSFIQPRDIQATVSTNNEIVEVEGRQMITKSATSVMEQLKVHKERKGEQELLARSSAP